MKSKLAPISVSFFGYKSTKKDNVLKPQTQRVVFAISTCCVRGFDVLCLWEVFLGTFLPYRPIRKMVGILLRSGS